VIKPKNQAKILCSFKAFCYLYDIFNWYCNWFHLLLKEDRDFLWQHNTSYKRN